MYRRRSKTVFIKKERRKIINRTDMNLKDEYKGRGWRRNGRRMSMRRRMDGLRMRIGGEGESGKDDG